MTDKIEKFISKLSQKDFILIKKILLKIESGNYSEMKLKKLEGFSDIFRVKKGSFRIILKINDSGIKILEISRRSEKTYRNY